MASIGAWRCQKFVAKHGLGFLALLLGLWVFTTPVQAQTAPEGMSGSWMMSNPTPTGRWVTANHDAVIKIAPCGQDLCGRIVGMVLGPNDPIPKDWAGDTQCGLTIIRTAPGTDGSGQPVWTGTIVDPRDGSTYHARITLDQSHNLKLRGYVGLPVFGQTQTWTAYNGKPAVDCRLQKAAG